MFARSSWLWLGCAALVGGGCTVHRSAPTIAVPAPLDFVAWLCADTCRVEFANADPLPYHAGAPATRLADGSFEIRYQQRRDGRWIAKAAGRLRADLTASSLLPDTVHYDRTGGLPGWRQPIAELRVHVHLDGAGVAIDTTVDGIAVPWSASADARTDSPTSSPTPAGTPATGLDAHDIGLNAIGRHLREAAAFVTGLADGANTAGDHDHRPCCAHHAPWRALAQIRRADRLERDGHLLAARDALRGALADAPGLPALDYRIGSLDRALGQDELAARRLLLASRAAADPVARSTAARDAMAAHRRSDTASGPELRDHASRELEAGRVPSASALAHAATAVDPDPVADLMLRHRLQRAQDDRYGSLGTALLLREYAGTSESDRLVAEELGRSGAYALARRAAARMLVREVPVELMQQLRSAGAEFARQTLQSWIDQAATPPK